MWTEQLLSTTARRLAAVHDASLDFDRAGATWQLPTHEPAEVICLNDVAPYNMVFDDHGELTGWIDIDTASPGPRLWDLAYLAYRLVPLTSAGDTGAGIPDLHRYRQRLATLCAAYTTASGMTLEAATLLDVAADRLEELAEFTATRAAPGAHHVAEHVAGYRTDAAWITAHAPRLM